MTALPEWLKRTAILDDLVDADVRTTLQQRLVQAHHAARQARAVAQLKGGINPDETLATALARGAIGYLDSLASHVPAYDQREYYEQALPPPHEDPDVRRIASTCVDLGAPVRDFDRALLG